MHSRGRGSAGNFTQGELFSWNELVGQSYSQGFSVWGLVIRRIRTSHLRAGPFTNVEENVGVGEGGVHYLMAKAGGDDEFMHYEALGLCLYHKLQATGGQWFCGP